MEDIKPISKHLNLQPETSSQKEQEVIDYENQEAVNRYLSENFEVAPNAKEIFKAKLYAYKLAAERAVKEKKEQETIDRRQEITRMWTYDEMKSCALQMAESIAEKEQFKFVLDEDNKHVFHLLCLYFTNDPKFEEYGIGDRKYSLKKGIWLQSPTRGTGKSVMLKCFQFNKRLSFGYKHTTELANRFQKSGYEALDFFVRTIPQPGSAINFYQQEAGMMYDELFGENKVLHMGSPIQVSEYIINSLYDFSNNYKGAMWKFHVTSNYDGGDIETKSGLNYRSRMADMFNLIKLEGHGRR